MNGRHLLQQSLKAGYRRGGESLTVGLSVLSTHTHKYTPKHKKENRSVTLIASPSSAAKTQIAVY